MANLANSDLPNATQYSQLVATDPKMRAIIWSEKVVRSTQQESIFSHFTGGDGSNQPVVTKRELEKGMAEEVTFTTIANVKGQGVLGETLLKDKTEKLHFGTYGIRIDLMRHAVAFTQLLGLVRLRKKTPMQLSSDIMKDWWRLKHDDDVQIFMRNRALLISPGVNLFRVNRRASRGALLSTDTVSTTALENSKGRLITNGANQIGESRGNLGGKSPKYLFFAPDSFLRPLRSNSTYLSSLQNAEVRSGLNPLWTGTYQMWDGQIIYPHNIATDDSDGRQGSPLQPMAFVGTAIPDGTPTAITGGGEAYAAGNGDYFAYFPGFPWKYTDADVPPADLGTHYAMIFNLTTDGKYEIFSYTAAGMDASGKQITGVTRGTAANFNGNVIAQAAGRFSNVHPSGSVIVPCTANGVLLGWAEDMGGSSVFHARGTIDAKPIFHKDDFEDAEGNAHLTAVGVEGVRGYGTPLDTIGRAKNFIVIEAAISLANIGIDPEPHTG
ncbi:DUF4043 family protein [Geminisphaera colitermitum]|uniref:phage capsid family protein n=1 Tax=Geminisphaera colitermitum TaxID=1148786 RepID=UPI000158C824|nr:DUF4043 family protein [Geminisphaera colitermitum]